VSINGCNVSAKGTNNKFEKCSVARSPCPGPVRLRSKSEWLQLDYGQERTFDAIIIYQIFEKAKLTRICTVDAVGHETVIWEGITGDPPRSRDELNFAELLTVALPKACRSQHVKLWFDTSTPSQTFGIDAVGLKSGRDEPVWAHVAIASSSHGTANWHAYINNGTSFMQPDWYPTGDMDMDF
jgi:hypothetical protein